MRKGHSNWAAGNSSLDRDSDGCHDEIEDDDDDGDGFLDDVDDRCSSIDSVVYDISTWIDTDLDGCHDSEDDDVDNDGVKNDDDTCDSSPQGWVSDNLTDYDGDGCKDNGPENDGMGEDKDDDNDGIFDPVDSCNPDKNSITGDREIPPWADYDSDGCHDEEDNDDDGDGVLDDNDTCDKGRLNWNAENSTDYNNNGCHDDFEDTDDDSDGINDIDDDCDPDSDLLTPITTGVQTQFLTTILTDA